MTAQTQDRKSDQYGTPDSATPQLLSFPVEANTTIYGGSMVATNAAGNAVPVTAVGALVVWGRCNKQVINTTAAGFGTAGALQVTVQPGVFYQNNSSGADAISNANVGLYCYAVDDQTVALTDGNGTRPLAGVIYGLGETGGLPETGLVAVGLGFATPYATNSLLSGSSLANRARAVATSVAAYTGTGTSTLTGSVNGALAAQDGITMAAGDVVFFPSAAVTNVQAIDAGPWVVTTLGTGGTKYVLNRPDWYVNAAAMPLGATVIIGGEGSSWPGTTWRSFAAKGSIIGTTAPLFYPNAHLTAGTVGGGGTVSVTGLYIAPTAKIGALNTTAAQPFFAVPTAGQGTGSLAVTGTATNVIQFTVVNF